MKDRGLSCHLALLAVLATLIVLCILYPFLPGEHDSLAMPLSAMTQMLGGPGLVLVPPGLLWLASDLRDRSRRDLGLPPSRGGYHLAIASLIAASIVAVLISFVGLMVAGVPLGLLVLSLWLYCVPRMVRGLDPLKSRGTASVHPAPVYLVLLPLASLLCQVLLAAPATELSRSRAIRTSAELIGAIERHRADHGRYPASLLAVWKDYSPSVIGIERFHYAPGGEAYSLFFEQPRFLFDNIGTREFVVYNKLDQHVMPSHASWILIWSPEQLAANQGWYAVHDAGTPHWKYFWFD